MPSTSTRQHVQHHPVHFARARNTAVVVEIRDPQVPVRGALPPEECLDIANRVHSVVVAYLVGDDLAVRADGAQQ